MIGKETEQKKPMLTKRTRRKQDREDETRVFNEDEQKPYCLHEKKKENKWRICLLALARVREDKMKVSRKTLGIFSFSLIAKEC